VCGREFEGRRGKLKMSDFTLGLDLDGTVGDYTSALRSHVRKDRGKNHVKLSDPTDFSLTKSGWFTDTNEFFRYHAAAVNEGMFRTMSIYPGAVAGVRALREEGVRVEVVTSRFLPGTDKDHVVADTKWWLEKHGIEVDAIHFMDKKGEADCDVYLDDAPHNIEGLRAIGYETIIYDQSYNRHLSGERVGNWEDAPKSVLKSLNRERLKSLLAQQAALTPSALAVPHSHGKIVLPNDDRSRIQSLRDHPSTVRSKKCGKRGINGRCKNRGRCPHHG
jgi:5'-nucleotidase